MIYITIGLLAAFIALAFFPNWLSANDQATRIVAAIVFGMAVDSGSYISQQTYRHFTHWQDPQSIREAQLINDAIRFEDQRLDIQINSTINGRHVPMHLLDNAYWCKRVR